MRERESAPGREPAILNKEIEVIKNDKRGLCQKRSTFPGKNPACTAMIEEHEAWVRRKKKKKSPPGKAK